MTNDFKIRYSAEFFEELDAIAFYIKNETQIVCLNSEGAI